MTCGRGGIRPKRRRKLNISRLKSNGPAADTPRPRARFSGMLRSRISDLEYEIRQTRSSAYSRFTGMGAQTVAGNRLRVSP